MDFWPEEKPKLSMAITTEQTARPRSRARTAGFFYLLTFATGICALLVHSRLGMVAGLLAGVCYVVVTVLFYFLFAPVNRIIAFIAAVVSLAGCAIGPLIQVHLIPPRLNSLVFFGFYCLLIGYLILRATFLPRMLGVGMIFAGVGWLTFFSPQLANSLSPYNLFPGFIGEGSLTVWLFVKGVNEERWIEESKRRRPLP